MYATIVCYFKRHNIIVSIYFQGSCGVSLSGMRLSTWVTTLPWSHVCPGCGIHTNWGDSTLLVSSGGTYKLSIYGLSRVWWTQDIDGFYYRHSQGACMWKVLSCHRCVGFTWGSCKTSHRTHATILRAYIVFINRRNSFHIRYFHQPITFSFILQLSC